MRKLTCLRCGSTMRFGMQEKLQMGQTGWILGDWPNILAGALELEVWFCPDCGTQRPDSPSFITVLCPKCGKPIKVILSEKTGVCGECGYVYNSEQK